MKQEHRMNFEIHIREAINGFVVNIGCAGPVVLPDAQALIEELQDFYNGDTTQLMETIAKVKNANVETGYLLDKTPAPAITGGGADVVH